MPIDAGEVRRIAALARLELDDASVEVFRGQLQAVLNYVARLEEIDQEPAGPGLVGHESPQDLREDCPMPGLAADEALRSAPDHACDHFRVPHILTG